MEEKLKNKIKRASECKLYGEIAFSPTEISDLLDIAANVIRENRPNRLNQLSTQIVFVAIVNACKDWSNDESNFWPHVFDVLGIHQYSQSNLLFVYKSINSLFDNENRKLYKTASNKNTYYSLILAHALGPKETMYHLFELFFSVYQESLLGYYRPNDPVFSKIAESLKSRINHIDQTDDSLDIGGKVYTMKSSIKHMINHDTETFIFLTDKVMAYFDGSLEFDDSDYLCSLLEIWKKRNSEAREVLAKNRYRSKIGFSEIDKFVPRYSLSGDSVVIEFPNLRLNAFKNKARYLCRYSCHSNVRSVTLKTFGNELIMNIQGFTLRTNDIDLQKSKSLDLRVQIFEDERVIFDSESRLHRKTILFKDGKEVFGNQLDIGSYRVFTTHFDEAEKLKFMYIDKFHYLAKFDQPDYFTIANQTWFVATEESRSQISKDIFVRTQKIPFVRFKEEKTIIEYEVIKKIEKISFNIPEKEDIEYVEIYGNDRRLKVNIPEGYNLPMIEAEKFPPFFSEEGLLRIAFIDVITRERIKVVNYLVLPNLDFRQRNRLVYGHQESIWINDKQYFLGVEDEIEIPYDQGTLYYKIPRLTWSLDQTEYIDLGPSMWFEELSSTSVIILNCPEIYADEIKMFIDDIEVIRNGNTFFIGQTVLKNANNEWKSFEEVYIIDQKDSSRYPLFKVVFKEKLFGKPYLAKEDGVIYWDVEDLYSGVSNPTFKVKIDNRSGISQIFTFGIFGEKDAHTLVDGEYTITVYRKSINPFESDVLLYTGSVKFGTDSSSRFNGRDIRIRKAIIDRSLNKEKVNLLISNLEYVKTDTYPEYFGMLYQENKKNTEKVYIKVLDNSTLQLFKKQQDGILKSFTFDRRTGKISEKSVDDKYVFNIDYFYYEEVKHV